MKPYNNSAKPVLNYVDMRTANSVVNCAFIMNSSDGETCQAVGNDFLTGGAVNGTIFASGVCTMTLEDAYSIFGDYCDTNGSGGVTLLHFS